MRKIIIIIAVAFGMELVAQTDTVMYRHLNDGTVDTLSISRIDSITFGYIPLYGACNGLTSLNYNGYTYDLVEIGNQCWFKENLQTTAYKDGTPIDYPGADNTAWDINTAGAYAWYDNDSITYASSYGALYNWYAVDNSVGLCPAGWQVPSDSAWTVLESYLEANGYNYDGSTSGNLYAKAMADSVLWSSNTGVGTVGNVDYPTYRNKSDFSCLPSGYRDYWGSYNVIGNNGYWWSSTQNGTSGSWYRYLLYNNSSLGRGSNGLANGKSVRCLKD